MEKSGPMREVRPQAHSVE